MLDFFKSKNFDSRVAIGDFLHIKQLDKDLMKVLKDLKLMEYKNNFIKSRACYQDLPYLEDNELKELIPHRTPRKRMKNYIKKTFGKMNPWEIDPSTVRMGEVINAGSYGRIRLGFIKVGISDIQTAIKEIDIDNDIVKKEDVLNEVIVMSKLRHDNVLKCFGCWFNKENDKGFICMEYCGGGSVAEFISKNSKTTKMEKLKFLYQIALGINYMHTKSLVHRDLKPQNVLIASDGKTLKICDFGTSVLRHKVKNNLEDIVGTPAFLSPEQYEERNTGNPEKIDVYAFGVVIWCIWTGEEPYLDLQIKHEGQVFKFLDAIHDREDIIRPKIKGRNEFEEKNCPRELIDLMESCWKKEIEKRPKGFSEIVEHLELIMSDLEVPNVTLNSESDNESDS